MLVWGRTVKAIRNCYLEQGQPWEQKAGDKQVSRGGLWEVTGAALHPQGQGGPSSWGQSLQYKPRRSWPSEPCWVWASPSLCSSVSCCPLRHRCQATIPFPFLEFVCSPPLFLDTCHSLVPWLLWHSLYVSCKMVSSLNIFLHSVSSWSERLAAQPRVRRTLTSCGARVRSSSVGACRYSVLFPQMLQDVFTCSRATHNRPHHQPWPNQHPRNAPFSSSAP